MKWNFYTFTDNEGNIAHYCNGKLHCETGPALIYKNGQTEYRLFGKRHRTDGPAVIYPNGAEEYWVNGKQIKNPYIIKSKVSKQKYEDSTIQKQ